MGYFQPDDLDQVHEARSALLGGRRFLEAEGLQGLLKCFPLAEERLDFGLFFLERLDHPLDIGARRRFSVTAEEDFGVELQGGLEHLDQPERIPVLVAMDQRISAGEVEVAQDGHFRIGDKNDDIPARMGRPEVEELNLSTTQIVFRPP